MTQALTDFFASYADLYNRALAGEDVYGEIQARFCDCFVSSGPEGVACGDNGAGFLKVLREGYDFYRGIGTKKMTFKRVDAAAIDDAHQMAKVSYAADYAKKSGERVTIDFDVTYMLRTAETPMRIFAFVAGDEMGLYRKHGLVD
jgi:hypothetical protein